MLKAKDEYKHVFFRSHKNLIRTLLMGFVWSALLFSLWSPATTVYASEAPDRFAGNCENGIETNCGITEYLITFINILSAVVGIIVVIMIVIGGIQYAAARDNSNAVSAARERIMNAVIALIFYLGITAFLQWVVPGGVFSG